MPLELRGGRWLLTLAGPGRFRERCAGGGRRTAYVHSVIQRLHTYVPEHQTAAPFRSPPQRPGAARRRAAVRAQDQRLPRPLPGQRGRFQPCGQRRGHRGSGVVPLAARSGSHGGGGVMMRGVFPAALLIAATPALAQEPGPRSPLIARAKALELSTPYVPPPGDPLEHHAAGFAKIICSAVFITGLPPDFAAENLGFFTAPYEERAKLGKPVVDRARKAVHVTLPNGITRTAVFLGDQGCVTLPEGRDSVSFRPVRVAIRLPDPATRPWPMGDMLPRDPLSSEVDTAKVRQAVETAFEPPAAMTAAFVVTWKGRIIGERYGEGIAARTPLESWSMGKSITATLMGILIRQGAYELWQPAPV